MDREELLLWLFCFFLLFLRGRVVRLVVMERKSPQELWNCIQQDWVRLRCNLLNEIESQRIVHTSIRNGNGRLGQDVSEW